MVDSYIDISETTRTFGPVCAKFCSFLYTIFRRFFFGLDFRTQKKKKNLEFTKERKNEREFFSPNRRVAHSIGQ